jgi:hypothetical protein
VKPYALQQLNGLRVQLTKDVDNRRVDGRWKRNPMFLPWSKGDTFRVECYQHDVSAVFYEEVPRAVPVRTVTIATLVPLRMASSRYVSGSITRQHPDWDALCEALVELPESFEDMLFQHAFTPGDCVRVLKLLIERKKFTAQQVKQLLTEARALKKASKS